MSHLPRLAPLALAAALLAPAAAAAQDAAGGTIPRFTRDPNPVALSGPARPTRYMEASGRRAAFLGREDGTFEAWAYPLKILHGFSLAFGVGAYADPIAGTDLATSVDIRPESATVRYAHAIFTVDATWLVPLDEPGGLVLLDVRTSEPITIVVRFRPDLKPMWPAALGGQYSYWDESLKAYVIGEGSGRNAALVGSPLGLTPPEQPAHNLPDAPSQFAIRVTPEIAARGLVPIVMTASVDKLDAARKTYAHLLASAESAYRQSAAHYRVLREEMTSLESPDARMNLAFEWGKVALDKGFVCNPHLGCGLIAGLGPSGTTERPGFGWFFGGDAFINAWAISSYGDFDTIRRSLEFLRTRQRADGKMMHELSQGAGYLRWFEDYSYGYYHADTTPLYIIAVRDYARATGDAAFAREFWASARKAFDYCVSSDEDGDGLMDNTKAGLVVETGKLRSRDVLTDVFLGTVWTEAAAAMTDLARIAEPAFATVSDAAARKARAALNRRFLDDANRRINFAIMKDGTGQAEQTVWPAFGIWRGVFDEGHPAVGGMLDELARAGIATDWGARFLSKDSQLYEPLSYNNGASWPFLSGWAACALYAGGRPSAAWQYLDALADLTFIESRGFIPELFSGDRARTVDAAVPHQLFATAGFVSALMRGMIGLEETERGLAVSPQLPPGWAYLRLRNLRWRGASADLEIRRQAGGVTATLTPKQGVLTVELTIPLGPGAELLSTRATATLGSAARSAEIRLKPGIEIVAEQAPLALGDESQRLRLVEARVSQGVYTARIQGRRRTTYHVMLDVPFEVTAIEGGVEEGGNGGQDRPRPPQGRARRIAVTLPDGPAEWVDATIAVRLGRRLQ
jgi:glycogen debranching enzyme